MVKIELVKVYIWKICDLWIWVLMQEKLFGIFSSSRLICEPRCWTSSLIAPRGSPVCNTPGFQENTPSVKNACLHMSRQD